MNGHELKLHAEMGDSGFEALIRAFYVRVKDDDILAPMYRGHLEQTGGTWEDAEWRLREFMVQRFGGPSRYSEARGHPRLRMRHMPFQIDQAARDRWLLLMGQAMEETAVRDDHRKILEPIFVHIADFMVNTPG